MKMKRQLFLIFQLTGEKAEAGAEENQAAARAGRGLTIHRIHFPVPISIHAPHAGRDWPNCVFRGTPSHFNPHAPCKARPQKFFHRVPICPFQSTRLMQGATGDGGYIQQEPCISIHAPYARRDVGLVHCSAVTCISIHAPYARRDSKNAQKTS